MSVHRNAVSCRNVMVVMFGKIQRYGVLTSFTSLLFILILKVSKYENFKMFKVSQEQSSWHCQWTKYFFHEKNKFQLTLDAFCEFDFAVCHFRLKLYSILLIFCHHITLMFMYMDVKFQQNLRILTWYISWFS